ncbi:MAG: 2OG-Fe(II) oxygenase family protein [Acidobacteria bacterium]|nr:2OG-Fe(II) oxygenase family protein [Acidobacteriota bacterium]
MQALIFAEEGKYLSLGRSNIGGWHSRPDFLNRPEPAIAALTTWVTWAVKQMVDATAGPGAFKGTLSVSAWATISRAGAYHAPHSHPDSAWSGVYYVDAGTGNPEHPLSGVLEFIDPRAGVEAVSAPGDPYGEPVRVWPESGLLVVFPSWLYHWVHPYAGQTSRIAVSYNATLGAPATVKTSLAEAIASGEIEISTAPGCRHNASHVVVTTEELNATRLSDATPTLTTLRRPLISC